MATKLQRMSQLSIQTTNRLTHSIDDWVSFLDSAAWLYKYPFPDQVLIHAQRPDARACASIELWNSKRFRRWVNKGATGIALIDDSGEKPKLKHVFDVSDTNTRYNIHFTLWQQQEQDEEQIIEELQDHFGEVDGMESYSFPDRLIGVIHNAVSDNAADYTRELLRVVDGSVLDEYDDFNISTWFEQMVEMSVAYCTLTRLGLDAKEYLDNSDFVTVMDFNTTDTITQLGTATADMTEMVLRQIERTVLAIRMQERDILAKQEAIQQNVVRNNERSDEYGTDLQNERGLSDSRYRDGRADQGEHREVRETAQEISEGTAEGLLQQPAPDQPTDGASVGDRQDSERADSADYRTDGENRGRDGEAESREPIILGAADEQHPRESRGNGSERPDLQLIHLFPSETEQQNRIDEAEAETPSAFSISQADFDNELCRGSGFSQGKLRIYAFYQTQPGTEAAIKFLKNEYGIGGHSHTYLDGSSGFVDCNGKGIYFANRNYQDKKLYNWNAVHNRLSELIRLDRYLSEKEKAYFPTFERQQAEIRLQRMEEAAAREALRAAATAMDERRKDAEYRFSLGDTVYLGAQSYTVLGYDESTVTLSDPKYPLLSEDMPRDVFERRLRENPQNDHLIVDTQSRQRISADAKLEQAEQIAKASGVEPYVRFSVIETDDEPELDGALYAIWDDLNDGYYVDESGNTVTFLSEFDAESYLETLQKQIDDKESAEWLYVEHSKAASEQEPDATSPSEEQPDISDPMVQEVFEQYVPIIKKAVLRDKAYINACANSDRQNADLEGYAAVNRAVIDIMNGALLMENAPFIRLYQNNSSFHFRLQQAVLDEAYAELTATKGQSEESPYVYAVGDTVYLDDTAFRITEIDRFDVQLLDPTLLYPIFRAENKETFHHMLEQDERNARYLPTMPFRTVTKPNLVETELDIDAEAERDIDAHEAEYGADGTRVFDGRNETPATPSYKEETVAFYPSEKNNLPFDIEIRTIRTGNEPKKQSKHDFRITDDNLGHGGAKTKFRMNMDAIHALQTVEQENRLATPDEQEVLSRYVGWGGIPQAFDSENAAWANEYRELVDTLTSEEYEAARASTLNAHYTSPTVIKAMYQCIKNMGFTVGNVLEPAMGIGNFFGLLPESMKDSKLYGVELDPITGRIARQLYQTANIAIQGFEQTNLPDSFFDVAIGNVPFGDYGVSDKRYDKNKFLIHDYFFAKTLDKVRPGGVVAFVTSSGTMDKKNPAVRKYIAQRADLLGAIRLPNNAFLANAGTGVVADILFLQKRDHPIEVEPDWVHLGKSEQGFTINQYFVDNTEMVLGELTEESTQYGRSECTVRPIEGAVLSEQLADAIVNIHAEIVEYERDVEEESSVESIPADSTVRNFSFAVVDGNIYFRENSVMNKVEVSVTAQNRIKGMIAIRDCTRRLIEYQLENYPDAAIANMQQELNSLYDSFTAKYGLINSRGNNMAFSDDSSYCLLCSLEVVDENGNLERKADIFSKRTIRPQQAIDHVDTAAEALAVSLGEKAKIDMAYMSELAGRNEDELFSELKGVIFMNPMFGYGNGNQEKYLPADEYLSGNVREKLRKAKQRADLYPDDYAVNVEALEKAQPQDLTASEIDVRLGATWLPQSDIQSFMEELLKPSYWARNKLKVHFSPYTAEWSISNKNSDFDNVTANVTYGTKRINGYKIIEETLNLKDVRIFDTVTDVDGNEKRVLNKKETVLAQQKQQLIRDAFRDWIWKDPKRRERLTALYNEKFNSIRPREYDGSHIRFVGMNPEITLRPHQVNAIARTLYGGNTLLAHVVGAGKTFEMVASAMESKRLGLCNKSLFVVPNHLTEQWAAEFLQLYPSANILVSTRKDFETRNRKKFCSRIATGDYDAVIIGHSQFEKIPVSRERQRAILEEQINEIMQGIADAKSSRAERFTIKQMEKTKRQLKLKLDKLNSQERKDDVVTFEELGVDRLFVDEAHMFKNLFLMTKMRNVAGLSQTEAQKSSDMYMKCRYMDELTGNRGIVFATGTPISNSMTEMYTMQRYLQYDTLHKQGLQHFDAWASTFGETITAIELAPEGTGYRAKTRFARFYNLPELIAMFKQVADVQTADMLKLPVPDVEYHNEVLKPSKFQQDMVASFSERAEKVRNGMVNASEDNMLLITNDGRKLALDQRLIEDNLPDEPDSKVNACVDNIYRIWNESKPQRSTQLVFSDLSTPHGDGKFNVYDDVRQKLIQAGVPEDEIAYIHEAKTETQKAALFSNVRAGNVRILLGSTVKMGAGTNVQKLLIAEHHLDIPWRPSDIEQREGRILRQGNQNKKVEIFRYVTENTFDSYMWQTIENKQRFISQIMTGKSPVRSCEDVDEASLSYAEIKALATGNPHIKEKMDLEIDVSRLKLVKSNHLSQRYALEDSLLKHFPMEIRAAEKRIEGYQRDIALYEQNKSEDFPGMILCGNTYTEKKDAGVAIIETCKAQTSPEAKEVGSYRGFALLLSFDTFSKTFCMTLRGSLSHTFDLSGDVYGNIQRMDNQLGSFSVRLAACEQSLTDLLEQKANAEAEVQKPFAQEEELNTKMARLAELDAMLNIDKRDDTVLDDEPEPPKERVTERDAPER